MNQFALAARNNSVQTRIHVGFGFHVGCYHTDTGDTNDEAGVAADLAAIRWILDELDHANAGNIPVRATWDFDNNYTLGRILPNFGPDILTRIKGRCLSKGDEVMLAAYNAGLLSAMTEDEFFGSLQLSESNPDGTGARDMFGSCSMILRPEASAFQIKQAPFYVQAGIRAVCLYYSTTPQDALHAILPPLPDEAIYNPIRVSGDAEQAKSLSILPMMDLRDIYDAGSLTAILRQLRSAQIQGTINRDVFVFINMDVRSPLWRPMSVRGLNRLIPGTAGLRGLIREARRCEGVVFNTPGEYLETHDPPYDISFREDVVSGGYGCFAETPWEHQMWTKLERARLSAAVYSQDCSSPSFGARVAYLSAAHFDRGGRSLSNTRRERALELAEQITAEERQGLENKTLALRASGRQRLNDSAVGKLVYSRRKDEEERMSFTLFNPRRHPVLTLQLAVDEGQLTDISQISFNCDECRIEGWTAISMERLPLPQPQERRFTSEAEEERIRAAQEPEIRSIFLIIRFREIRETYHVYYRITGGVHEKSPAAPIIEIHEYELPVFNPVGAMRRLLEAQGKLEPLSEEAMVSELEKVEEPKPEPEQRKKPDRMEEPEFRLTAAEGRLVVVVSLESGDYGQIRKVSFDGKELAGGEFLRQYVRYAGAAHSFNCIIAHPLRLSGEGDGLTILGEIHVPGEEEKGLYQLDLICSPFIRALLVRCDVRYPRTPERDVDENGRSVDLRWEEIAPLQIAPVQTRTPHILRRDFTGHLGRYPVSDFGRSIPENRMPVGFNQHLTGGILGVQDGETGGGCMIAHARSVLGGIAFCPMSVTGDLLLNRVSFNLFGTYLGGGEVRRMNASGGLIQTLIDMSHRGERSRASCYNGVRERMVVAVLPFTEEGPTEAEQADLMAVADSALVSGDENGALHPFLTDNVFVPEEVARRVVGAEVVPKSGEQNTFAAKCAGDSPEIIKLKKEALIHFRDSLRRR
ncbi:MAG: hypothetical protein IJT34_02065 [Butyrivibrio sp.]|nr:hypothetical protein [Butyrivibrio sp.]